MRKKLYALMVCAIMLCVNVMPVCAEAKNDVVRAEMVRVENAFIIQDNVDELLSINPNARGENKPSSTWNIADSGQYNYTFSLYPFNVCYSSYYFTGVSEAIMYINAACNVEDSANYGVEIYEKGTIVDTLIEDFNYYTDTDSNYQIRITNMNPNKKYYFKIVNVGNSISGSGYFREA